MDGTNRLMNEADLSFLSGQDRGFLEGLEYILDVAIPKYEENHNMALPVDFKEYIEVTYSEYVNALVALRHGTSIENIVLDADMGELSDKIISQIE